MMKLISLLSRMCLFLMLSLSLSYASVAQSLDVIVVASSSSELSTLSRGEVRQIFMGGTLSRKYDAATFPIGDATRILFNTKVIGLTESRIQSYWAQLLFTGRSKPPKEFTDVTALLEYIVNTENAVGYVPADTRLPDNVVVLYQR